METAAEHKIQLLYLPSHTSHITQPLDVACFFPPKAAFHEASRSFASFEIRAPQQKQLFIKTYQTARTLVLTEDNIWAGFRATGIFSFSRRRALRPVFEAQQAPATDLTPTTPQRPSWPRFEVK
ncbi:hypothetical protein S40285_09404 [Stachybotrys chlorohalonatus IBT 40285]|uniref:DDE-1 domain-containing protein n=1 Tax=Stachybotrys chlorohalonatus (strain IBT 40285) TaxID=1283841 RepID=A0A084QXE9_STAC4|nr:hypothetical protein S40285_09404 [Stachybotrys chlorohalonata IBT 40285]